MENDQDILVKISQGDQKAFKVLFDWYYNILCGYCSNYIEHTEECQNLVQEVMVDLWQRRNKAGEIKSVKSYLYGAVKNKCANYIKHQVVKRKYENEAAYELKSTFHEQSDLNDKRLAALNDAIEKLSPKTKEVFKLKRLEGKSYKEIAETLDISERTVETHVTNALKFLRTHLKNFMSFIFMAFIN